ncbi:MAG: DUF1269 domain-containing protein [Chloroflexi bacterium]|nr:DUF1269 domain-containing protein [Chloroflexota bacterium]
MSKLIVFTYENQEKAGQVLQSVAELSKQHLIEVEDAAVIVKDANGKVKVHQTLESLVKSSNVASGGFWGLLIGLIFGGPIFMALLGMGLSALFGRKLDVGIDNQFIKNVGSDMKPGDSALFLLTEDITVDKVADALREHGGTLYHTSLSKEAEENLAKALEHAPIAKAVEAQTETEDK